MTEATPDPPGEISPLWSPARPPQAEQDAGPSPAAGPTPPGPSTGSAPTGPVPVGHTRPLDLFTTFPAPPAGPSSAAYGNQPDGPQHAAGPRRPPRGPGWWAVIGIATAMAVLGGVLGSLGGNYLANTGRLSLGRSEYKAPSPRVGSTSRPAGSVASIAAIALPSVVTIQVKNETGEGTGSGWVFDSLGHVVTNNHVVEGSDNGTISIELADGKMVGASVVGRDVSYDLAVLKVTSVTLKPLPLGRSADVVVGDQVIAVGAPLGLESTVTTGIVSALNRPVSPGAGSTQSFINAIQTDAAINPGNSGGPLLDMQGRVIGVNSAIARLPSATADAQSGNIGVGFSIPSDQVGKTVEQLIRTGKAVHPIIGVYLDQDYDGDGVRVARSASGNQVPVNPGGPADKAGIRPGDVILTFEGQRLSGNDDLVVAIRAKNVGDEVTLHVRRDGRDFDVRMTLQGASG